MAGEALLELGAYICNENFPALFSSGAASISVICLHV